MQLNLAFLEVPHQHETAQPLDAQARVAALEVLARIIAQALATTRQRKESGDE